MWASTSLRALLAGLLVVSAILFAVGSTLERHQHGKETPAATHQEGSGGESGGESTAHVETHREKGVTLVLLAAAAWLLRQRLVLLAIVAFGLVFAAGDVR